MSFEEITNNELVINLTPIDLLIHARHLYLSAAKDLLKSPAQGDMNLGLQCAQTVESLQQAIDIELLPYENS